MTPVPMPDEETKTIISWIIKLVTALGGFISGIVVATWTLAYKMKGFEDRLSAVEKFQQQCAGQTLEKIDTKIDWIIQEGLREVHNRIDSIKDEKNDQKRKSISRYGGLVGTRPRDPGPVQQRL